MNHSLEFWNGGYSVVKLAGFCFNESPNDLHISIKDVVLLSCFQPAIGSSAIGMVPEA